MINTAKNSTDMNSSDNQLWSFIFWARRNPKTSFLCVFRTLFLHLLVVCVSTLPAALWAGERAVPYGLHAPWMPQAIFPSFSWWFSFFNPHIFSCVTAIWLTSFPIYVFKKRRNWLFGKKVPISVRKKPSMPDRQPATKVFCIGVCE